MTAQLNARLTRVALDGGVVTRLSPVLEADRAHAMADLAAGRRFEPAATNSLHADLGPYELHLSVSQGRLVFDVHRIDSTRIMVPGLALGPFRSPIKAYQFLVDSYGKTKEEGREACLQVVDMGRRGPHNEGAALLRQRLDGKIAIDFATSRRLFTLVCMLRTRV